MRGLSGEMHLKCSKPGDWRKEWKLSLKEAGSNNDKKKYSKCSLPFNLNLNKNNVNSVLYPKNILL